jgi:predicted nucleotidyltransferase
LKNKKFKSEAKSFLKKNKKEIIDIMIFGSAARGKDRPKDIDVLVVFKDKVSNEIVYELRKSLEKTGLKPDIVGKTCEGMLSSGFLPREDILSDGYSLSLGRSLSESFGYRSFVLFKYGLKDLNQSERIRFHYALMGRGGNGSMIKKLDGIKFTSAVVLVPVGSSEPFEEFLESWGIKSKKTRILIPAKTLEFVNFEVR